MREVTELREKAAEYEHQIAESKKQVGEVDRELSPIRVSANTATRELNSVKMKLAEKLVDSIDFQEYKDIIDVYKEDVAIAESNEEKVEDLSAPKMEGSEKEGDIFVERRNKLIKKYTNSEDLLLLLEQLTNLFVKQKENSDNMGDDGSREVDDMTLKLVRCLKHSLVNFRV